MDSSAKVFETMTTVDASLILKRLSPEASLILNRFDYNIIVGGDDVQVGP